MAQQTINIGTAPNDGTGTPWRTAWTYVNEMFAEIYASLGNYVTSSQLAAETSARQGADTSINSALGLKANAADVAGKADKTSVVPMDVLLAGETLLTRQQRLTHAKNGGQLVTLAFLIFPRDAEISSLTVNLPPLPQGFYLEDAVVVVDRSGGGHLAAAIIQEDNEGTHVRASWGDVEYAPDVNYRAATCVADVKQDSIEALGELFFVVYNTIPGYTAPATFGMTLWLKGVWK